MPFDPRADRNEATEIAIAAASLNRRLAFGRPIRIDKITDGVGGYSVHAHSCPASVRHGPLPPKLKVKDEQSENFRTDRGQRIATRPIRFW
jgi:hypothetical protein